MTDNNLDSGVYDLTAAQYHADMGVTPSLSSSIAKTLVDKTPRHAWLEHPRLNDAFEAERDTKFALGAVAHEILLGKGGGYDVLDFDDYRTNAAKAAREASWEDHKTPILAKDYATAVELAQAVCKRLEAIPECRGMMTGSSGQSLSLGHGERCIFWRDTAGILCRAMIDWIGPTPTEIWDVKTVRTGLSDDQLQRQIIALGYDLSAAFYLRGLEKLFPEHAGRFRWRWIFVEAEAPYEVRVIEPSGELLHLGARKVAVAMAKWAACMASGQWPGYPPEVTRLGAPEWAETRWLERETNDPDAASADLPIFAGG